MTVPNRPAGDHGSGAGGDPVRPDRALTSASCRAGEVSPSAAVEASRRCLTRWRRGLRLQQLDGSWRDHRAAVADPVRRYAERAEDASARQPRGARRGRVSATGDAR